MKLEDKYPKLFDRLEDKDLEIRHLLTVDENYEDYDSEEFEFDYKEYNYIVYISELTQEAIGIDKLNELIVKLDKDNSFENFLASEIDLYALKSNLSTEEIEELILNQIEGILWDIYFLYSFTLLLYGEYLP